MKKLGIASLILGSVVLTGCATVASPVGNGAIVTSVKGPIAMTPNVGSTKTGESCATNVLGLFANGDASIETARKNGSVSTVSSVDHTSFSVLFLYSKFCTVVHGE